MRIPVIAIIGPTASGKSRLAIEISKAVHGEVISADSRQLYRGLNLGTGTVTHREMEGVPHHLIDIASPMKQFSVAEYVPMAEEALKGIVVRGHVPVVCGGTGQYVDALLRGTHIPEVPPQPALRASLEEKSAEELMAELRKVDPARAETIDPDNKRRIIRAIEIVKVTGKPVPQHGPPPREPFDVLWLGIDVEPEQLRAQIETRLRERVQQGMVREVQLLHARGLSWERMEELGLEYRYTARHLQGHLSREEYLEQLATAIWQYSRRQATWWRRHPDITWIKSPAEAVRLAKQFIAAPH